MISSDTLAELRPGEPVDGRFVIEDVAGVGGMGVVYRARDLQTGAAVALKVLRVGGVIERARFAREAQALASLTHPHIVRLIAHGHIDEQTPYLVMEWLIGEDLAHRLLRGPLSVAEAVTLILQVAEALGEAHSRSIVHRDIKPQNLFLLHQQLTDVRVVDFGLVHEEEGSAGLTQAGTLLGTPGYMSPEQARGSRTLSANSDVFSLGCVLFECLTGVRPFGGDSVVAVLSNLLLTTPPRLQTVRPEAPLALDSLLNRMLAKEPAARPADCHQVAFELRNIAVQLGLLDGAVRPGAQHFGVEISRSFPASPALVLALLADTDRWNRLNKMPRTNYLYQEANTELPDRPTRVGHAEILGTDSRWLEVGEGVEGQYLLAERWFIVGPFLRTGCRVEITPEPTGCAVRFFSYLIGDERLPEQAGEMMKAALLHRLGRYLDAVQRLLLRTDPVWLASLASLPPITQASRVLLRSAYDPILHGPIGAQRTEELVFRTQQFIDSPVDSAVRDRIVSLIGMVADDLLRHIQPFELAAVWGLPPRAVLLGFVHATKAGLTDLFWQLICPRCQVAAGSADSLTKISRQVHCAECQIKFDADLASNIEAVFRINPTIRVVASELYCAGSWTHRPHLVSYLRVPPLGERTIEVQLPAGPLLVRVLQPALQASLSAPAGGSGEVTIKVRPAEVAVQVAAQTIDDLESPAPTGRGAASRLMVHNETALPIALQIERLDNGPQRALGTDMMTLSESHDMFSTDAPATGLDLQVSTMTLLHLELLGAPELCQRLGDGEGFVQVQDQLGQLTATLGQHQGGVLRVHEETLTACFVDVSHALSAAAECARLVAAAEQRLPELAVRAGVYAGPCLAVRRQERLDFFGRGPMFVVRQVALVPPWQLWLPQTLLHHPTVARLRSAQLPLARELPGGALEPPGILMPLRTQHPGGQGA